MDRWIFYDDGLLSVRTGFVTGFHRYLVMARNSHLQVMLICFQVLWSTQIHQLYHSLLWLWSLPCGKFPSRQTRHFSCWCKTSRSSSPRQAGEEHGCLAATATSADGAEVRTGDSKGASEDAADFMPCETQKRLMKGFLEATEVHWSAWILLWSAMISVIIYIIYNIYIYIIFIYIYIYYIALFLTILRY